MTPAVRLHWGLPKSHVKKKKATIGRDARREGNRCKLSTEGFGHTDYQFDKQAKVSRHKYTACCPSPFPSLLHIVSSDLRGQMSLTHHSLDIADSWKVCMHPLMADQYLDSRVAAGQASNRFCRLPQSSTSFLTFAWSFLTNILRFLPIKSIVLSSSFLVFLPHILPYLNLFHRIS